MNKQILTAVLALALPAAALADLTGTKTLAANTSLNLDSGATASTGGDILWNGSALTPQANAKAFDLGPLGSLDGLGKSTLDLIKSAASLAPIPSSTLAVGEVIAVFTNGGNTAAVLVTANSGGSITLQFITFGVAPGGGGGGPSISKVLNNSSLIPAGFPNSGIAQGSLFQVLGSGLADDGDATLHSSEGAGLPSTLNGASITVTVGSTTVNVALYYATPTQIDGVLPANTPTGSGTLTVTHNGTASITIQIVVAAPGITTYNNGTAVAQDNSRPTDPYGGLITFAKSAAPGAIIIVWGSGVGPTGNSDTAYDTSGHQTSVSYTVYIGGVQAAIAYKGASVYPGVSVLVLTVPQNVPTGCYVPIAAVANVNGNSIVSNIATLPIHAGGGACSDPQLGFDGDQISMLNGLGTVRSGFVIVSQLTSQTGVSSGAAAIFQKSSAVSAVSGATVSIGACILSQTVTGGSTGTTTGLNAGTITVTGPGGSPVTLSSIPQLAGYYSATLASVPANGGAYVFNGSGASGSDTVGPFSTTVNFPNPLLTWSNQSAAATVGRGQGLVVNWNGGTPGSLVIISGSSAGGTVTGSYTCIAPQSALTFTVPSYILLGLPAGTGTTSVTNSTNFTTFTATGLDFGGALGLVSFQANSNYN